MTEYLKALWRQWKVFLTGGSLIAVAVIYSFATAHAVNKPWGLGLLVATFILASFGAWKEEHQKVCAFKGNSPRLAILYGPTTPEEGSQFGFLVEVTNPGPATSLVDDWRLEVEKPDGTKDSLGGGLDVRDMSGRLEEGRSYKKSVAFHHSDKTPYGRLAGARFVMTVSDIHGHTLRAEHPKRSA